VRSLLTTADKEQYDRCLAELESRLSPAFVDFYELDLNTAVLASAEFTVADLGIQMVPYVGITNIFKSYNRDQGLSKLEGIF